ncbi:MAG: S1C family serine protease [Dehalococcoidia bacterium]
MAGSLLKLLKPGLIAAGAGLTALLLVSCGGGGGDDEDDTPAVLTGAQLLEQNKYSVVDILTTTGYSGGGGTGVVWEESKYILTNAHVVVGAGAIKIVDPDDGNRTYPARVVALSSCDDVALLEVDRLTTLKPAKFGDSKKVGAGDTVTALGFPATISSGPHTAIITNGNVSRVPATFEFTGQRDLIQNTAPINPGNSGGPLYNQKGEVIGLNSYAARGKQGENYAIASNEAISVANKLKSGKNLDYVGLSLEQNDRDFANEEDLAYIDGLVVTGVDPGSPADKAKPGPFEFGFLIYEVNGTSVDTVGDFCDIIRSRKSGETVRIRFGAWDENDRPFNNFQYDIVMP